MDPFSIALGLAKRFWKEIALVVIVVGCIWAGKAWLDARDAASHAEGYGARDALVHAEVARATAARAAQVQENVESTRQRDQRDQQRLTAQNTAFRLANTELRRSLEQQASTPFVFNPENPHAKPNLGQSVLLPADVGLLNAARVAPVRLDEHGRATFGFDGEGAAPAYAGRPVTGGELAENDLEVVRLYRALAIRHDSLVDWVGEQCMAPKKP